tara:strand:+ start:279 stop:533 length:255 start_codon:yes stop_codon:yes gene_type:complete
MRNQKYLPSVEELKLELELLSNARMLSPVVKYKKTEQDKIALKKAKMDVSLHKNDFGYKHIANTIVKKFTRRAPRWGSLRVLSK